MANVDISTHIPSLERLQFVLIDRYENFSLSSSLLPSVSDVSFPTTNLTNHLLLTSTTDNNNQSLNWPILSLSILAIFGTIGNLLVCAAISLDKQLQTVTNWFLFSLAIADCLVSMMVLPLSIIKDFQGSWQLPVIFCNIYVFLDVLLCTTSIWHLTVVSIDRFLYISRPFRSRERSKRNTFLTIILIWTCSVMISCTILFLGFADERNILTIENEHRRHCALNNRPFIIYGSIVCFCVPCILMLVSYALTIRHLQFEAAKCYSDPDNHLMMTPQTSDRLRRHRSNSKKKRSSPNKDRPLSSHREPTTTTIPSTPTSPALPSIPGTDANSNQQEWPPTSISKTPGNSVVEQPVHHPRSFLGSVLMKKAVHAFKVGTETTSERRAMKVLGIVFFVFLVAWLPFSILNILSAACPSCGVQTSLLNLTSWLGYISSNLNPIIYTAFNVRFRRAFVSILTCRPHYFSHKRNGKNLYVFIASNNHQTTPGISEPHFFSNDSKRRFQNHHRQSPPNSFA